MRATSMLVLLLGGVCAAPLHAQSGAGYLFGAPWGSITLRGGYSHAQAGSDLYDEMTQTLTLSKKDFSGATFGAELAFPVTSSLDLSFDAAVMSTNAPSHYRNFVDNNNGEIQQTTGLSRVPLAVNARLYLTPPGRSIGKFAWIPNTFTPWIGGGAGVMYYRFHQDGDFIDPTTNNVYADNFQSDGWTPMTQAMAGVDVSISPRLAVTGDARYLWAKRPTLSSDYQGYQPLDLSGALLSLGLTIRL